MWQWQLSSRSNSGAQQPSYIVEIGPLLLLSQSEETIRSSALHSKIIFRCPGTDQSQRQQHSARMQATSPLWRVVGHAKAFELIQSESTWGQLVCVGLCGARYARDNDILHELDSPGTRYCGSTSPCARKRRKYESPSQLASSLFLRAHPSIVKTAWLAETNDFRTTRDKSRPG